MENEQALPGGEGEGIPKDQRDWAMFAHLSALAGYVVGAGVLNFLGPLIIWLIKREEMPYVDDQAKEALNFQITLLIGVVISIPLCIIFVGFITMFAIWILGCVFTIVAAIKTQEGEHYRYPFTLRLIT